MKTNALLGLFLISISFSLISCKEKTTTEPPKDTYCYEYEGKPAETIGYVEIAEMINEYEGTRGRILEASLGRKDTRENFYELDALKKYLAYLEKMSDEKDIELTGITMISAVYPNNYPGDPKERNYQTLIFAPTTKDINGRQRAFDPIYSKKGEPAYFHELLRPYLKEVRSDQKQKTPVNGKKYIVNMTTTSILVDQPSSAANRTQVSPPYPAIGLDD
ncbi:hypothetical protein [Urechidicola croceus]|uniref:Lipoprotein n=1 Tax=Urechidicola croceus TaxID=1850246 RepID=A0A1D8PA18_9FLAO|nr:hypothetical protein [Urechidicola croceus]AOW21424.1 hypothetical protein LPB138_12365 [Urechidicola croceus]